MALNVKPKPARGHSASSVPPAGAWPGAAKSAAEHLDGRQRTDRIVVRWAFNAPSVVTRADGAVVQGKSTREWLLTESYNWHSKPDRDRFAKVCALAGLTEAVRDPAELVGRPVVVRVRTRGQRSSAFIEGIQAP